MDPLSNYAEQQRKLDPVLIYTENREQEVIEDVEAKEELERCLRQDIEPAKFWQDMHLVDRDCVADLQHGSTAYRLIGHSGPVIVLLHGAFSYSYIWMDLMKRLSQDSDPWLSEIPKRFLFFDFYGRGRSPWPKSNPRCTAEFLSSQLQELLTTLGLINEPLVLVGHDMGCVVGASFIASASANVLGLIAIGPAGTSRPPLLMERELEAASFWGLPDEKLGALLEDLHQDDFFEQGDHGRHYDMMVLHISMIRWQIDNTPG